MIISRYLAKEVYLTLLATTAILLLIFLSHEFVRFMRYAASGELAASTVMWLLLLQLPVLLSLLLPLSLFLAILLAYGRMYADNEMTILAASGIGSGRIVAITLSFSFIIMVFVAFLSIYVGPRVNSYSNHLWSRGGANPLEFLTSSRFHNVPNSDWILYVGEVSRDKTSLQNIFAAELAEKDVKQRPKATTPAKKLTLREQIRANILKAGANYAAAAENEEARYEFLPEKQIAKQKFSRGILLAQGGYQKIDKATGDLFLVLTDGYRYLGEPGQKNFQIIKYKEYGIRLPHDVGNWEQDESNTSTAELWKNRDDNILAAELQWRISLPITVFVLTLLGTLLSKIRFKLGRYSQLLPAIMCYIIYVNLLFVGRAWLKKGVLTPALGMWWVHGVMFVFILVLLFSRTNWRRFLGLKWGF